MNTYAIFWPDCSTKNCANKVCTWGSSKRCFPCEEKIVGTDEMHARYDRTHERSWDSTVTGTRPNYMTRTYAEIVGE